MIVLVIFTKLAKLKTLPNFFPVYGTLYFFIISVLWSMLSDYGYQIMTEEQRETKPVKDLHFVTLTVSAEIMTIFLCVCVCDLLLRGWQEQLVETSASCTLNIKLSIKNLCCFYIF